jgi:hypothetical protein
MGMRCEAQKAGWVMMPCSMSVQVMRLIMPNNSV